MFVPTLKRNYINPYRDTGTPPKMNMESEKQPFEEKNHLNQSNQTFIFGFHVNFHGCMYCIAACLSCFSPGSIAPSEPTTKSGAAPLMAAATGMDLQSYEELLDEQLASLRGTLLRKHTLEVSKCTNCTNAPGESDRTIGPGPLSLTGDAMITESFHRFDEAVEWEREDRAHIRSTEAGLNDPIAKEREHLAPWARFVVKLLEHGDICEHMEPSNSGKGSGALKMRSAWKVSLQEGVRNEGRSAYQVSILSKHMMNMSLKINDAITDDSFLQRFVCRPQGTVQLAWSFLACVFILWDVITMPLEMFSVPWLMQVLDVAGIVTFSFWTIDIPLHFIFGIQLEGTLELRPSKLAGIYLRSWFVLDVLVVMIDIFVFILEAVLTGGMEGSMIRSARYLRVLRLLRLVRLLRVIKLTRELTLLANRFLSTHAFMVMKIVAGLCMMIAMNHLIACVWYGLASMRSGTSDNWVTAMGLEEAGFGHSYAASTWTESIMLKFRGILKKGY